MAKRITIDLNDYQKVDNRKDADLMIIPAMIGDHQLAAICYKLMVKEEEKKSKDVTVADCLSGFVWTPTCTVDVKCSPQDYLFLIKWWFESCSKEENRFYIDGLASVYPSIDIRAAAVAIRKSLETYHTYQTNTAGNFSARITSIDRKIRTLLRTYERNGWYTRKGFEKAGGK